MHGVGAPGAQHAAAPQCAQKWPVAGVAGRRDGRTDLDGPCTVCHAELLTVSHLTLLERHCKRKMTLCI